ncbi:hypothetical protein FLK61_37860 [Paenalkalicoccus suaedae]|uniref:Copper amine oxidase n=1 Tax=Paenalkalicoccus suaedae TaxID=2592382 RepID=A0A859FJ16_9BACI|nr:stalk domain-containing protein [Paenalkalicoccus suaedae]QKS72396.1 hypothetical protein FLK61_37860 [Paenalkalicoccus suaedae]
MKAFIGTIFAALLLVMATPVQAEEISYLFNGEENSDIAENLYISENRVFVPLRAIFEDLGASVYWMKEDASVYAQKGDTSVTMWTSKKDAYVSGSYLQLDVNPQMKDNHVYVPLRFVSEAFGADVKWDAENHQVSITEKSGTTPIDTSAEQNLKDIQTSELFDWVPAWPGDALPSHQPDHSFKSSYPFTWNVYMQEHSSFYQLGHRNGQIDAIFYPSTVENGAGNATREQVLAQLGEPKRWMVKSGLHYNYGADPTWDFFEVKGMYVTVFYDVHEANKVVGIQAVKKSVEDQSTGFYGVFKPELRESYEQQLFLLTNMERERQGIKPLTWHESSQVVARAHSEDMATNQYFSHTNLKGESPFDRLRNHDILFQNAGENLARRQMSPIHAHFNLLESKGHRDNMLQGNFRETSVGVAFEDGKPYFTQKFITNYSFMK